MRVKSPLRLSLAGGGTDLPEWYQHRPAHLLSVAVDMFVEVEVLPGQNDISQEPQGPLVQLFLDRNPGQSCLVRSDCSPGAGLGGSGALAVCLVAAEAAIRGHRLTPAGVAAEAYRWEREYLGEPVGFQDPFASALGGVVEMTADASTAPSGHRRSDMADDIDWLLEHALVIAETPIRRAASTVLGVLSNSKLMASAPADHRPAGVAEMAEAISSRDGAAMGEVLLRHWAAKRRNLPEASSPFLDTCVETAIAAGAMGAKVIGAGGGGFLMVAGSPTCRQRVAEQLTTLGCVSRRLRVFRNGVHIGLGTPDPRRDPCSKVSTQEDNHDD